MSTGKTENYNLNQWDRSDLFLMEEFNADNAAIDAALAQCALVKLKTITLTEDTTKLSVDLSDLSLDSFRELHFSINACHNGTGLKTLHMTLNDISEEESYLYADMTTGNSFSTSATMPVGPLTRNFGGCQSGLKLELALFDHGISYHCTGIAEYSTASSGYTNYAGTLGMENFLTPNQLTSVEFLFAGSSAKLVSGSAVTIYGLRK